MKSLMIATIGLALIAHSAASQELKTIPLPEGTIIGDARFTLIPKVGGLDWAVLLDTKTGRTWRLGAVKFPNTDPQTAASELMETRWVWVPIEICDICR